MATSSTESQADVWALEILTGTQCCFLVPDGHMQGDIADQIKVEAEQPLGAENPPPVGTPAML